MREEKQLLLDEISRGSKSFSSLCDHEVHKITAKHQAGFRNESSKVGGEVEMVPKRF